MTPSQEFMILTCFIYPCINFQTSFLCNVAARTCSCRQAEDKPPSSRVGLVTVKMDKYYIAHGSTQKLDRWEFCAWKIWYALVPNSRYRQVVESSKAIFADCSRRTATDHCLRPQGRFVIEKVVASEEVNS